MRQMKVPHMCASGIHKNFCIGSFMKDYWCSDEQGGDKS
uniref:Uncharacterized protein n=1 Tax=Myoviridae sp. ctOpw2 TaxID=2825093 RepID=A0A8S5UDA7_9CAUD|nr:MAG TPA: hypothetical protein [Myoviridae sp. ctOpw2]DAL73914.1 MAG TPA: hypothetical protein [Caudoviricetes sp.]